MERNETPDETVTKKQKLNTEEISQSGEEDEIYEVEKILDKRITKHKNKSNEVHYLIRWKGYGPEHDTWEPRANMIDCKELVEKFERNLIKNKDKSKEPSSEEKKKTSAFMDLREYFAQKQISEESKPPLSESRSLLSYDKGPTWFKAALRNIFIRHKSHILDDVIAIPFESLDQLAEKADRLDQRFKLKLITSPEHIARQRNICADIENEIKKYISDLKSSGTGALAKTNDALKTKQLTSAENIELNKQEKIEKKLATKYKNESIRVKNKLKLGGIEVLDWNKKHNINEAKFNVMFADSTTEWEPLSLLREHKLDKYIHRYLINRYDESAISILQTLKVDTTLLEMFDDVNSKRNSVSRNDNENKNKKEIIKDKQSAKKKPAQPRSSGKKTNNNTQTITKIDPLPEAYLKYDIGQDWKDVQLEIPHFSSWLALLENAREPWPLIINDVDAYGPPTNFTWTEENIYTESVEKPDTGFLIGCDCSLTCSQYSCRCPGNGPHEHPFAYEPNGQMIHGYTETSIVECNKNCLCDRDACPNRTVQNGRKLPLVIFKHPLKGWGVKTIKPLPANTFVEEYTGLIMTAAEAQEADAKARLHDDESRICTYLFDLDGFMDATDMSAPKEALYTLDANNYGNISHFFNHSCDPNMRSYSVLAESADVNLHRLAFFTIRDVQAGEELTFHYSGDMRNDENKSRKRKKKNDDEHYFRCYCGASNCESKIRYKF